MKRIVAIILAITLTPIMNSIFAANKDDEGHTLVSLWKSYYSAVEKDKPKEQASILEDIKKEAAAKRLSWDFYDACGRYVDARTSTNWKLHDELTAQKEKELDEYDDPFVNFFRMRGTNPDRLLEYASQHKDELKRTHSQEFYGRDGQLYRLGFGDALVPLITNDYDFALWHIFFLDERHGANGNAVSAIRDRYGDEYPFAGFIDFTAAYRNPGIDSRRREMEAFVASYGTKAVSLLGRQNIINADFNKANSNKNSTGKDFEKIKAACEKFISDQSTYRGSEKVIADCCISPKGLLDRMNEKSIDFKIINGKLSVFTRNLPSVKIQILDGKKNVHEKTLDNPAKSYYVRDTIEYDIPAISDGEYDVKCFNGKIEATGGYEKYTLSLAVKKDSFGYAVYVADYLSGKPLETADITLVDNDGNVAACAKNLRIDGFTYLPEDFQKSIEEGSWGDQIYASAVTDGLARKSQTDRIYYRENRREDESGQLSAMLLTDRGAYNPDETLHYKVILYNGLYDLKVKEGERLTAVLLDTQNNIIGSSELTTNEYGSAAGDFVLKRSARNGMYSLDIKDSRGYVIASRSVRVDDFVLPTFELTWTPGDQFYLPGDEICVTGRITSYSGHPVSSAKAEYTVERYGSKYTSGELVPAQDGTFSIRFAACDYDFCHYGIKVKVTDSTGETREFSTSAFSLKVLPISTSLKNYSAGRTSAGASILSGDVAEVLFELREWPARISLKHSSLKITYDVFRNDKLVTKGSAKSGEVKKIDLSGNESGVYVIRTTAVAKSKDGKEYKQEYDLYIQKVKDSDTVLGDHIVNFFKETADEIGIQFGHCGAPVWAIAELYGSGDVLLQKRMVTLDKKSNLKTVTFEYEENYPDVVRLKIFYFLNGSSYEYGRTVYRKVNKLDLPLSFSRFLDTTKPGATYTFNIKTAAGVECAATIFDKSTETMGTNVWQSLYARRYPAPSVSYETVCGRNSGNGYHMDDLKIGFATKTSAPGGIAKALGVNSLARESVVMSDSMVVEEEVAAAPEEEAEETRPEGYIRENFANTIAWEPFLRSDKDGNISFKFTNADKLSTYYVQLFAHRMDMHNAALRKEMVVTIPVKIAVVEPQVLYTGDKYLLRVSLANSKNVAIGGKLAASFLNGGTMDSKAISSASKSVSIPANGNYDAEFAIDVPDISELGIKLVFTAGGDYGSDGVFVAVPVGKALQEITEAHSSILLAGQDREALIAGLRSQFVNVGGSDAALKETSIIDMIREALPDFVKYKSENSVSLTEALYSNWLIKSINPAAAVETDAADKLKKCQNRDGGFGWFEGMDSSPVLTIVIMERFAAMKDLQKLIDVEAAVKYLDKEYLGESKRPYWCGNFSQAQYLYLRSLYPAVNLDTGSLGFLARRTFKKSNKEYLTPSKERGLNGQILAKARRLKTLRNLITDPAGKDLADALGISSSKKIQKSLQADIESLLEYAEPHRSGGQYYPNAVMPWRGLLESELYAHSLLCDLFDESGYDRLADDIRLWIMVQKETQKWEDDPAFIEAIASVLRGSEDVLKTKVVILSATTTLPFGEIKASGNGFRLERKFYRDGVEIKDGEQLKVGDKIVARFKIWNEENRSFVRLTAPRNGALRPAQQLSGRIGWHLSPIRIPGWLVFRPQGYRSVLRDRTEFWFDSYPEENTTLEEEYFVTQAGTFQSPVPVIESLYAPHYRANGTSSAMNTR